MEALEKTYRDVSTMKMKYDHLFVVCNNLLKNWPQRDSNGKVVRTRKEDQHSTTGGVVQDSTSQEPLSKPQDSELEVVDKAFEEMQLLDAILQKAKKIRSAPQEKAKTFAPPTSRPKSSSLSAKSSQQAAKIYKQPVSIPTTKRSKVADTKQRKRSASSSKAATRSSRHVASVTEHFATGNDKNKATLASDKEGKMENPCRRSGISVTADREKSEKSLEEVASKDNFTFSIEQHGGKLSMPSRYYCVQQALSKMTEEAEQNFSSVGGQKFSKRIESNSSSKGDGSFVQAVHKMLIADELSWLREKLLSLTVQELTVNERNSWEEVWQIKTKLEALAEHAQKVGDTCLCKGTNICSVKETRTKLLVYGCLEEWESLATAELQLLMTTYELELLKFVSQKLFPLLPLENCPTHLIQTVFELAGVTKPIYVKL